MPREIDLPDLVGKLKKASPDAFYTSYIRFPNPLAHRVAQLAFDRGVTLTQQLRDCVEEYLRAAERGVLTSFEPSLLDHLNLAATHLGLDRESLVRQIVAEHINEYLGRALGKLESRKELQSRIKAAGAESAPKPGGRGKS